MKVFRRKLVKEREVRIQPEVFRDQTQVLGYSWELFKDKLNSKVQ